MKVPRRVQRGTAGAAGLVLTVAVAGAAAGFVLAVVRPDLTVVDVAGQALSALGFAGVGALLIVRRPHEVVGRICAFSGVLFSVNLAASSFAEHRWLEGDAGPLGIVSAWLATWLWVPAFTATFLVLPVLFPDGRLPSRRWRPYLAAAVALPALQAGAKMVAPGPMHLPDFTVWPNPLGVAAAGPAVDVIDAVVGTAFVPVLVLMVVAVARRFRAASALERQQLRWFLTGVTCVLILFMAGTLADRIPRLALVLSLTVLVLPASIGIAVLRYRLYDLDRVVSRTLTYGIVTGVLAVCYLVGVLVLGAALQRIGGSGDLAVAASTLAVAALFVPLRRRVQGLVDRRFNRVRYDAERTVEAFRHRLRGETQLDEVTADLVAAVHGTVEPAGASVWLRLDAGDAR